MAAVLGFEPRQTESESAVLPLHNTASSFRVSEIYYTTFFANVNTLFRFFSDFFVELQYKLDREEKEERKK